ncbi:pitrilysin family protein [Thioalkalivibrio sp. XN279]|uniref:M16 family metallopeptidase n=1 Tax=Thioalkalivibrio sp. XN279 TaxID=2714953 RepID=UPI001407C8DD|nr:pitrilysin family protein [Thioalkalivibrio sp. XN279]NHA13457.1 insulinase family protein [Thioalkalivibrio sp. XN279]
MVTRLNRLLAVLALSLALPLAAGAAPAVDIPYEEFTLDNGLRVIVHTDRKAPIVAVNIWYHVGSKNEPEGRTGFAHLFEHLMFQGSENYNDEYFKPFEQVGATGQNGTTSFDRTNYFQNVPTTALDMALWMESDRMGHFMGAITQERLDEQRGVVKNEKRQRDGQPYGQSWDRLFEAGYPEGHPYSWMPIGSMEDLDAATLDDVKDWFRTWYGPNNAVLVLAGDIDVPTAREKVTRYFGDIPAGPPLTRPEKWIAARTESTRETMQDRVAQARIYRTWNMGNYGSAEADHLALAAQILGGSASSRLQARLVHQEQLVSGVYASAMPLELSGVFMIVATAKDGVDPAQVEAIIDEEVAKFLDQGPTRAELAQAKTRFQAGFIRGVERVGGFGGKSDVLAGCAVYTGDPGCFRASAERIQAASTADVRAAARARLAQGDHTLTILPFAQHAAVSSDVDRSQGVPEVTEFPQVSFPALQRATLQNGIEVVLAERREIPVVQVQLQFDAGYAADVGRKLGTASFAMNMLDQGAGKRDTLELAAAIESEGAFIGAGAGLDTASVSLNALKDRLDPSLALFADVALRPRFDEAEIERVRRQWLAGIAQEKTRPQSVALRLVPPLLYGEGHAYAIPFSGTGTEEAIASLTREDLVGFHRDWMRPDNARFIVVGDITMGEIVPLLEKHFGDWEAPAAPLPQKNIATVARPDRPRVFLVDQPGSPQANIIAAQLVISSADPASLELDIANGVFGGSFTSRINMNLREDKGWSYGVRSSTSGARGQRPWYILAPVEIARTGDSIRELIAELEAFTGERPAEADELEKIRANRIRSLPGRYETASAVLGALSSIEAYGWPDDQVLREQERIQTMTLEQVREAAKTLDVDTLTWVVVGDLEQIEPQVRALDLGEVTVLDADGRPL